VDGASITVVGESGPSSGYHSPIAGTSAGGILLGLELLVARDIIRTVAVTPTFASLGILAGIVLIRTFLSFSLQYELEHRWPLAGTRS
jgi:uncharacterized membrane protein